ncbi:hypothetical protein CSC02_0097 [Enterobacter hormaechei subsp. hoffmannii]|nr:hypothetical protein CSC02_0097 [Enterobacter hormaechei subsp. hoffmannii]
MASLVQGYGIALFCSSIGSEIKTGINSGIYVICENKSQ